jgi:hypothetical protein
VAAGDAHERHHDCDPAPNGRHLITGDIWERSFQRTIRSFVFSGADGAGMNHGTLRYWLRWCLMTSMP